MIISNSTPPINFAAIRRLDILERLFGKICVPKAVKQELLEKGKDYPSAVELKERWFQDVTRVEVLNVQNIMVCRMLQMQVDNGEAEAIALALEQNPQWLILDESEGRRIAKSYNIPIIGSIGCLIEAKRRNIIPAIKPLLDAMQTDARFWVHAKLYTRILRDNHE